MAAIPGVTVHKVSDRTFLLHLGGKIEMRSKVPLRNRDDLSMAYTPGRGAGLRWRWPAKPEDARRLTIKRNTSPSSPTARPCSALATSAPTRRCR